MSDGTEKLRDALPRILRSMDGFPRDWYVAGGWALDLFLGSVSREHADIEIAIFRDDQEALRRHLVRWRFEKATGGLRVPWELEEWLVAPVHELHGWPEGTPGPALEILLNERIGEDWVYRRNPAVRRRAAEIGGRSLGVPYLRPEIVLLYKAKSPRPVDEQDFNAVVGRLDAEGRAWLHRALKICHPGHHWLQAIEERGPD